MVAAGLVEESGGMQYGYKLTLETAALLEKTPDHPMTTFKELGQRLIEERLWSLELGSTILFYFRQKSDWDEAMRKACAFKNVPVDNEGSHEALALAKQFSAQAANN